MEDKGTNDRQLDEFSRLFSEKLNDHRLPVYDEDWEAMESLLKPRRRIPYIWSGIASVAAVGLLCILLIPRIGNIAGDEVLTDMPAKEIESVDPMPVPDPLPMEELQSENLPVKEPPVHTSVPKKNIIETVLSPDTHKEDTELQPVKEDPEEMDVDDKRVEKDETQQPVKPKYKELPPAYDQLYPYESKKRKGWLVSAGVNTGGSPSFSNMMDSSVGSPGGDYENNNGGGNTDEGEGGNEESRMMTRSFHLIEEKMYPVDDYREVDHAMPFTIGFTARKELTAKLAIETGLSYSYLSTSFLYSGNKSWEQSKLGLHYLGIPVNLTCSLWEQNNWSIYVSGGVMLEKGVRAVFKQKIHENSATVQRTTRTSINGVQFSLQVMPGVSYNLGNDWQLFVEPKISWYMDNNQPVSIRTEKTWIVGIGGGLRYRF